MWRYIIVGLLAFVIAAAAMTPARVVRLVTDDIQELRVGDPEGTIWKGRAKLHVQEVYLGEVDWTLSPWRLLAATAALDWSLTDAYHRISGVASAGINTSEVSASGYVDAPSINSQLAPYHISISGRVDINSLNVIATNAGRITYADGELRWPGGETSYRLGGERYDSYLPPLMGTITTEADSPTATIYAENNPTTPLIRAELAPSGWVKIGITKQFTKIVGNPWPGSEPDHAIVLEVEEKLF